MCDAVSVSFLSATRPATVFVLGDVAIHRDGLVRLLQDRGVQIVGSGPCIRPTLADLGRLAPDIVVLDVTAAVRLEEAHRIRATAPEACIVALAVREEADEVVRCVEAGIRGYVDPEASAAELAQTIERVAGGEAPCSPNIASALMRRIETLAAAAPTPGFELELLTIREREIVELIADGLSNKEIARHLRIELPTVKTHVHHVLAKMHVRRRSEVAALLYRTGPHRTGKM